MFPELLTLKEGTDAAKDPSASTLKISLKTLTSSQGKGSMAPAYTRVHSLATSRPGGFCARFPGSRFPPVGP